MSPAEMVARLKAIRGQGAVSEPGSQVETMPSPNAVTLEEPPQEPAATVGAPYPEAQPMPKMAPMGATPMGDVPSAATPVVAPVDPRAAQIDQLQAILSEKMNQTTPWWQEGLKGLARGGAGRNTAESATLITAGQDRDDKTKQTDIANRLAQLNQIVGQKQHEDTLARQAGQDELAGKRLDQQISYQNAQSANVDRLRATQERDSATREAAMRSTAAAAMLKGGQRFKTDPATGMPGAEVEDIPENELPPERVAELAWKRSGVELREAQTALAKAREELAKAGNDPTSPLFKLKQQSLLVAQQRADIAQQNADSIIKGLGIQARNSDRADDALGRLTQAQQDMMAGFDQGITNIKAIIPMLHEQRNTLGPVAGNIKLAEISKLGGMGATPEEIKLATRLQVQLMAEAFANGGKQLTPTELGVFKDRLPKLSDTFDTAITKATEALKYLEEKRQLHVKYFSWRQREALGEPLPEDVKSLDEYYRQREGVTPKSMPKGPVAAPAMPPVPKVGEVRGGYIFLGGDPALPASWKKP